MNRGVSKVISQPYDTDLIAFNAVIHLGGTGFVDAGSTIPEKGTVHTDPGRPRLPVGCVSASVETRHDRDPA